jgi:hypothetical protein
MGVGVVKNKNAFTKYANKNIPAACYLTICFLIEINTTRHCIPSTQSLTTAKLKKP